MMNSFFRPVVAWLALFVLCLAGPAFGQEFLLRNNLVSGQVGRAVTQIDMVGDSLLTGQKAATQLRMRMTRDFQVSSVDGMGNARVDVAVRQIQTQGKMDNASFNKNLTGDELQQVMFGADQMTLDITPLGMIKEGGDFSFEQLGIALPASVGDSGGFEFPTFPAGPVRIGSVWNEKGILILPGAGTGGAAGNEVYQLSRVIQTPQGRVAVIRYKKLTDLSGLGLGGNEILAAPGAVLPNLGGAQAGGAAPSIGQKSARTSGKTPASLPGNGNSANENERLAREVARLANQAAAAGERTGQTKSRNERTLGKDSYTNTRNGLTKSEEERLEQEVTRLAGQAAAANGGVAQPGLQTAPLGTAASGTRSSSPSVKAGGLVVQLEGEIEFNIDQGAVIKTTQHGMWNLNLNMNNLPSLQAGSTAAPNKTTNMTQKMNMNLQTQFQWRKPPTAPSPAVQSVPALPVPPQLPVEKLSGSTTPPRELP
ncbi:MAG: hypothetical protein ACE15F_10150 [bacterium]